MLREIMYVDITRVRSLIGQLDRGVVESVVERSAQGVGTDLFSALGMGGLRKRESTSEVSQTRSVEDILFVAFEEAVESEGLLRDVDASDMNSWEDSSLHLHLEEGELIRVHADVLVLDPAFLRTRLDRFMAVGEAMSQIQRRTIEKQIAVARVQLESDIAAALIGVGGDQRKQAERTLRRKFEVEIKAIQEAALSDGGTFGDEEIKPVAHLLNTFFTSDAITIRVLPCGRDRPEFSFVGSLLGRDEYIQRERDALFSRYGAIISGWTSVLQVAAISHRPESGSAQSPNLDNLNFERDGVIDRAAMERASVTLLAMMDSLGVSEGPRWPAVSVVPLGIYRTVPRSISPRSKAGIVSADLDA